MPIASGETIGFQVTVLLTMVVYLDILSKNVPKFERLSRSPTMLIMFMLMAFGSMIAHVIISKSRKLIFFSSF